MELDRLLPVELPYELGRGDLAGVELVLRVLEDAQPGRVLRLVEPRPDLLGDLELVHLVHERGYYGTGRVVALELLEVGEFDEGRGGHVRLDLLEDGQGLADVGEALVVVVAVPLLRRDAGAEEGDCLLEVGVCCLFSFAVPVIVRMKVTRHCHCERLVWLGDVAAQQNTGSRKRSKVNDGLPLTPLAVRIERDRQLRVLALQHPHGPVAVLRQVLPDLVQRELHRVDLLLELLDLRGIGRRRALALAPLRLPPLLPVLVVVAPPGLLQLRPELLLLLHQRRERVGRRLLVHQGGDDVRR